MTHLTNCGKNPLPAVNPTAAGNTHRLNGIAFVNIYAETGYMLTIRKKLHHPLRGKSFSLLLLSLVVVMSSCNHVDEKELSSPPGYDLNKPVVVKLPGYLDEISGIAFYPKDKAVFAIDDEKGWLYKIFLTGNMAIQKWKYGKGSDFEDLAVVDSVFYVLQSKGNILAVRFRQSDSTEVESYKSELPGKNEFEILYQDKERNKLMMLCKDCEADNKKTLTAYAFDLTTHTFDPSPAYVIDVTKIDELMKERKVKFKPSAASIDPRSGKLFMISSINKIVAVADRNGNVENVYKINPKLFKQPEGLTFSPEGHLLISNESAGIGASNIFIFKYNPGK